MQCMLRVAQLVVKRAKRTRNKSATEQGGERSTRNIVGHHKTSGVSINVVLSVYSQETMVYLNLSSFESLGIARTALNLNIK